MKNKVSESQGTKVESALATFLRERGFPLMESDRSLPGAPDLHLYAHHVVIFVDGRFWHDPAYAAEKRRPHHTVDWTAKARRNRARDREQNKLLVLLGYHVIRIWDTSLCGKVATERTLAKLLKILSFPKPEKPRTIRL